MRNVILLTVAALGAALLVAACDETQPTVIAQPSVAVAPVQAAPVIVQQPSNDGFFTGMLMGHLMSGGGGYSHHTTVVNRTYVTRNTFRSYTPSRSYSSRSSFGSFRRR